MAATSSAVVVAQNQLAASSASSVAPTVTVTSAMRSATSTYMNVVANSAAYTSAQLSAAKQTWGQALSEGYALNSYVDTDTSDQAEAADWTNLTTTQADELSWFAEDVINEARDQLGLSDDTGHVVVTRGAVAMAIDVANKYQNDRYTELQHYYTGINSVASEYGLLSTSKNTQYYENLAINVSWDSTGKYSTQTTMADLKNQLYTAIMRMLFQDEDSNYGHTVSLLGIIRYVNFVHDQTPAADRTTYLGVATDAIVSNGNLYTRIHIIDITDASAYIKDETTFQAKGGETVITAPTSNSDSTELQAQLTTAQSAYQAAQAQFTQAQTKLSDAQANLKTAQDKLVSLQKTTNSSTNTNSSTSSNSASSSSSTTVVKVIGPDGQVIGTWSLDDPSFPYRWALNN